MFEGSQETVQDNKSSSYPVFELPGVNCIKIEAYLQNRMSRDCHIIFLFQKLRTSSWQLNHSENSIKHQTEALTTSEAVGHKCSSKYVFLKILQY